MLSENEVFDIAEATKAEHSPGKSLSLWWLAIPCLMSVCILTLVIASYQG